MCACAGTAFPFWCWVVSGTVTFFFSPGMTSLGLDISVPGCVSSLQADVELLLFPLQFWHQFWVWLLQRLLPKVPSLLSCLYCVPLLLYLLDFAGRLSGSCAVPTVGMFLHLSSGCRPLFPVPALKLGSVSVPLNHRQLTWGLATGLMLRKLFLFWIRSVKLFWINLFKGREGNIYNIL